MAPRSLLLCFVSPVWAVWSLILMLAAAPPANAQGGDCSTSSICGNLTISEPFGIVLDEGRGNNCGSLGFQVACQTNTPYLGYYRQGKNSNGSLLVADIQKFGNLANMSYRDCGYKFPAANTSSKIALPFSISPINQQLILYSCITKPPAMAPAAEGLVFVERCGNKTFVARVGGSYEPGNYDGYYVEGCDAIVVSMLGESGKANASNSSATASS